MERYTLFSCVCEKLKKKKKKKKNTSPSPYTSLDGPFFFSFTFLFIWAGGFKTLKQFNLQDLQIPSNTTIF